MPTVHGHATVQRELPQYATCVECHRTYRPRTEDQACVELCDECFESAKYPHKQAARVHVRPRVEHPKPNSDIVR
jgi:hypothetical protein